MTVTTTTTIITSHQSPWGGEGQVYVAWEPSTITGPHQTITHLEGHGWVGEVASRRWRSFLPPSVQRLPSPAFCAAVEAFTAAREAEAIAAILAAHPELHQIPHRTDCGHIVTLA